MIHRNGAGLTNLRKSKLEIIVVLHIDKCAKLVITLQNSMGGLILMNSLTFCKNLGQNCPAGHASFFRVNLNQFLYFSILRLTCLEGKIKFTLEPPNPSYVRKGSNATLVWQYSVDDKQAELQGVVFSVLNSTVIAGMIAKTKDGVVLNLPNIPSAYKGRVSIKGNATLIIENVSPQDNTRFQCKLSAEPGAGQDHLSMVQLIVTGKYCKMFVEEKKFNFTE